MLGCSGVSWVGFTCCEGFDYGGGVCLDGGCLLVCACVVALLLCDWGFRCFGVVVLLW